MEISLISMTNLHKFQLHKSQSLTTPESIPWKDRPHQSDFDTVISGQLRVGPTLSTLGEAQVMQVLFRGNGWDSQI